MFVDQELRFQKYKLTLCYNLLYAKNTTAFARKCNSNGSNFSIFLIRKCKYYLITGSIKPK